MKLLQKGNSSNIPSEVWLVDSAQEVSQIPNSAPSGSIVLILTNAGLQVKMKNNNGDWKEL